ncbi:MAG: GntR family transcriptional regulator [Sciscionella sp.]
MPTESSATREAVAERVARVLREAIDSGQYPPGVLLPSEKLIAANFEVSAPTVRESLAILSAEGRVKTVNGKGTLVLEPPVPRHVITFDPADPWRDLTTVEEPKRTRGAADTRTAALLNCPRGEFVHLYEQTAIHTSGALVRARRILPHLAYDGMERYPDPMGQREAIIKALTDTHGPLTHQARCGAAIPTTDDRKSLKAPSLGTVVLYAAAITRAPDGRGLLLDILNYNAAEAEITTTRL